MFPPKRPRSNPWALFHSLNHPHQGAPFREPRNKSGGIKADTHSTDVSIRQSRRSDRVMSDAWARIDRSDIFIKHNAEADQCRKTINEMPPDDLDRIAAKKRLQFITSVNYAMYLELKVWLRQMGRRHGNELR